MLKDRKKPKEYRDGKLTKLLDLVQRFSTMKHDEDFINIEEECISFKCQGELIDMMRELRDFDITEIGDLYLTSGGRIVLDQGYGESFGKEDTVIFTLKELKSGMSYKAFKEKIEKLNRKG